MINDKIVWAIFNQKSRTTLRARGNSDFNGLPAEFHSGDGVPGPGIQQHDNDFSWLLLLLLLLLLSVIVAVVIVIITAIGIGYVKLHTHRSAAKWTA